MMPPEILKMFSMIDANFREMDERLKRLETIIKQAQQEQKPQTYSDEVEAVFVGPEEESP